MHSLGQRSADHLEQDAPRQRTGPAMAAQLQATTAAGRGRSGHRQHWHWARARVKAKGEGFAVAATHAPRPRLLPLTHKIEIRANMANNEII